MIEDKLVLAVPENHTFFEAEDINYSILEATKVQTSIKKQITATQGMKSLETGSELISASLKVALTVQFFIYIFGLGAMSYIVVKM